MEVIKTFCYPGYVPRIRKERQIHEERYPSQLNIKPLTNNNFNYFSEANRAAHYCNTVNKTTT